jgi:hypothetical protein
MAISPNVDFVAGAILTATQQNQFPRGIMAYNQVIVTDNTITAEEVQITGSSFTAVANRYYKVTYYEPVIGSNTATGYAQGRLRLTNLAGATKQWCVAQTPTSGVSNVFINLVWVGTLSAGTTNFVATLTSNAGTLGAARNADYPAFLMVEDIGPA